MNPFNSRKLLMGLAAIAVLAASAKLGLSEHTIWIVGAVAIACSGSQAIQDLCKAAAELLRVWSDIRPFILSGAGDVKKES